MQRFPKDWRVHLQRFRYSCAIFLHQCRWGLPRFKGKEGLDAVATDTVLSCAPQPSPRAIDVWRSKHISLSRQSKFQSLWANVFCVHVCWPVRSVCCLLVKRFCCFRLSQSLYYVFINWISRRLVDEFYSRFQLKAFSRKSLTHLHYVKRLYEFLLQSVLFKILNVAYICDVC